MPIGEGVRRSADPALENFPEALNARLRDRGAVDQHRQVGEGSLQPAGRRQPQRRAFDGPGVERVLQAVCGAQRRADLRPADLFTNVSRIDEGDGALNHPVGAEHHLPEPRQRIALRARVVFPLGLDHYRPAGRLLDQHIGAPGAALQSALVLGQDGPAGRAELLQDLAELDVDRVFAGRHAGECSGSNAIREQAFGAAPLRDAGWASWRGRVYTLPCGGV